MAIPPIYFGLSLLRCYISSCKRPRASAATARGTPAGLIALGLLVTAIAVPLWIAPPSERISNLFFLRQCQDNVGSRRAALRVRSRVSRGAPRNKRGSIVVSLTSRGLTPCPHQTTTDSSPNRLCPSGHQLCLRTSLTYRKTRVPSCSLLLTLPRDPTRSRVLRLLQWSRKLWDSHVPRTSCDIRMRASEIGSMRFWKRTPSYATQLTKSRCTRACTWRSALHFLNGYRASCRNVREP
jgi:hypothetical protein